MPPQRADDAGDGCLRGAFAGEVECDGLGLGAGSLDQAGGLGEAGGVDVGDADGAAARGELDARPRGRGRRRRR